MVHQVKHGLMEVVPKVGTKDRRPPDLIFKGTHEREFAVYFAPYDSIEATTMVATCYDYHVPFEAAVLAHEEEDDVKEEF